MVNISFCVCCAQINAQSYNKKSTYANLASTFFENNRFYLLNIICLQH